MKIVAKWFFLFFAFLFSALYLFFSSWPLFLLAFLSWTFFLLYFFRRESTNLYVGWGLAVIFGLIGRYEYALFLLIIVAICSWLEEFLLDFLNKKRISSFPQDSDTVTLFDQKTKNYHPIQLRSVKPSDIIVVKPNEKILVDGIVFRGRTVVMRFSTKLNVKKGDFVLAGDQNLDKEIYIQVQKEASSFMMIALRDKIHLDYAEHKWYKSIPFWFSILFLLSAAERSGP